MPSQNNISCNNNNNNNTNNNNGNQQQVLSYSQMTESLNFTGVTNKKINEAYHIVSKIGEGISGSVFKAIKKGTNEMVALKNFKGWNENDRASKEECTLLLQLRHIPYVTPIIDIYTNLETSEQVVVFPYFEHDLSGLLSEHRLSIPQVKCYFKQLLEGIREIHRNGVMHRDIKAANILVNNKGSLFIGDLGTATSYVKRSSFSSRVVTLWYRAPELLLGSTHYGPEIDMWSIGCVLIELVTSRNFLPGNTEAQQMEVISKLCGTPTEANWEGVSQLPLYQQLVGSQLPNFPSKLRSVFKNFQPDFIELLEGLLTLNPKKRITADQALASPFFTNHPLPFKLENMPGYQPIHVLEAVQKRAQQTEKQKLELEQQQKKEQKEREQREQREREEYLLKQQRDQREKERKLKEREEMLKKQEELKRKQEEQIKIQQKLYEELQRQEKEKERQRLIQQQQQSNSNSNSPVKNNLKRSLEIVNDIRNYCTESSDEECDCEDCESTSHHHHDVVEVVEVDVIGDDDGYFTDDEDQDDSDDSDNEHTYGSVHFHFTPIKSLMSTPTKTPSSASSSSSTSNPFLQPPKKQRTTSPTFSNTQTPLIIH
ncbi:putative protein serine/threonine kinase [Tieghemostelium lacteum]|uniref:cyclin-dependent kinase n=1 Tax=Tieghemostelium lacteum TaxID=361077 RepID=A0A152A7L0_TIELA|nr:putative protein serine/threonine kinase [Tieghemostelium lacteum]|eukprot:KYR02115.1 putative protein serine/threonine kinase [Tieghemostelium lacteum]